LKHFIKITNKRELKKMRIKKLNRRIFKRNLKRALKPEIYKRMDFDEFCKDYEYSASINNDWGVYELEARETKSGHAELVYTN
jgi:hypothetical protein